MTHLWNLNHYIWREERPNYLFLLAAADKKLETDGSLSHIRTVRCSLHLYSDACLSDCSYVFITAISSSKKSEDCSADNEQVQHSKAVFSHKMILGVIMIQVIEVVSLTVWSFNQEGKEHEHHCLKIMKRKWAKDSHHTNTVNTVNKHR